MDLVYFIVLVGVLIFVHESGHFLWAKFFGVRVLTFSLGFGPKVAGFSRGGTDYVIAALPLGGYVRMLGENPHEQVRREDEAQAFHMQPVWRRVVIVFAGPMMNLIFPLLLYFVVFLGTTKLSPAIIGDVFPGQPADGKLEPGDRITGIDGEPVQTFYDLTRIVGTKAGQTLRFEIERDGESLTRPITPVAKRVERPLDLSEEVGRIGISVNQPLSIVGVTDDHSPAAEAGIQTFDWVVAAAGKRCDRWGELERVLSTNRGSLVPITVLRPEPVAGPLGALLGVSIYTPRVSTLMPKPGTNPGGERAGLEAGDLYVSKVLADSPEARAGLRAGDRLFALDGQPIRAFSSFLEELEAGGGKERELTVRRDGELVTLRYALAHQRSHEYEQEQDRYAVGLRRWQPTLPFAEVANPNPVAYAFHEAVRATGEVIELTAISFVRLFQGRLSMKSIGGPLTIFDAAGEAAREGAMNYLFLMGFISVNLGLINLMPIPLLDGGHLLFFLIELVTRKPLSARLREYASLAGLTILILLMVFAFKNDVERQWPQIFQSASEE
ncbi:MAG: Membrane-associated zinc metalloprotease [Myxococcaceae bacterium]|nr:Membrane-associated zinc metalloprotease [Myxococcaceae bacterium]